jgi:hypothetical protein
MTPLMATEQKCPANLYFESTSGVGRLSADTLSCSVSVTTSTSMVVAIVAAIQKICNFPRAVNPPKHWQKQFPALISILEGNRRLAGLFSVRRISKIVQCRVIPDCGSFFTHLLTYHPFICSVVEYRNLTSIISRFRYLLIIKNVMCIPTTNELLAIQNNLSIITIGEVMFCSTTSRF